MALGLAGILWEWNERRVPTRVPPGLRPGSAPERLKWKYQGPNLLLNGPFLLAIWLLVGWCLLSQVFVLPALCGRLLCSPGNRHLAQEFNTEQSRAWQAFSGNRPKPLAINDRCASRPQCRTQPLPCVHLTSLLIRVGYRTRPPVCRTDSAQGNINKAPANLLRPPPADERAAGRAAVAATMASEPAVARRADESERAARASVDASTRPFARPCP